jgi:hypothetical protein
MTAEGGYTICRKTPEYVRIKKTNNRSQASNLNNKQIKIFKYEYTLTLILSHQGRGSGTVAVMKKKNLKIGVLALQGAFIEHCHILQKLGVEALEIRLPGQLREIDGLIMPGGESTTILKLMHGYGLFQPLKELIAKGFPV